MRRTLLSGFGPFGTVISNPTERLVRHFARAGDPGHRLTALRMPTSFQRAPAMIGAALRSARQKGDPFGAVLMLGVANGATGWRVERQGMNATSAGRADADGFDPCGEPLDEAGPAELPVTADVERIVDAIRSAGLPVEASDSAGIYVCNAVLYRTLRLVGACDQPPIAAFLHVPADEQTFQAGITTAPVFAFEQQVVAVEAALAALRDG